MTGVSRPRAALRCVRSVAEVERGPPVRRDGLEHGGGHQPHQLGAGDRRRDGGGHPVVGVGRTDAQRVDEVHRHLHPVADGEAEGPDAGAAHRRRRRRRADVEVGVGQPHVVGHEDGRGRRRHSAPAVGCGRSGP